jgi:hypothetical protein
MGRPKGSKNKIKSRSKPKVNDTYETEVEFMCPVRGKIKQKVKVKKLKPASTDFIHLIPSSEDALANIEDDGLDIYDETDEDIE